MRVNGADHRILGKEFPTVPRAHACGPSPANENLLDVDFRQNLATVSANAGHEGVRQLAAAAHWNTETIRLEEADEHEHAQRSRLLIRRDEVLARDAREMHADLV